ncbi:TPA: ead/Ea22-like family protein [Klebsiella variicola subsp. variicola]
MTTDITELAQSLKAAATNVKETAHIARYLKATIARQTFKELMTPDNILALVEALEKAQQRNAELEAQNDYFASLVAMARVSADKAIRKFPQPNYVLLKVAEEAGEVVQAGVHYAENRMEWGQVEGEIVQLLAMLIRLVTEGDQVNGITPPALCSAGIKVEAE